MHQSIYRFVSCVDCASCTHLLYFITTIIISQYTMHTLSRIHQGSYQFSKYLTYKNLKFVNIQENSYKISSNDYTSRNFPMSSRTDCNETADTKVLQTTQ